MAGFRLIRRRSRSEPLPALARAVGFVLEETKRNTPFVTTGKIDAELNVVTEPLLVRRGARAGLPYKNPRSTVSVPNPSLALRIMLARLNKNSDYNALTDMRYALDRETFSPGMGTAGFWARLQMFAQRMVKSRHSSTHFFQISWNAVIGALIPYLPGNYRGYFMSVAGADRDMTLEFLEIGQIDAHGQGLSLASIKMENRIGMEGRYPTIDAIRNMEANRILPPILQAAIDKEFESQCQLAMRQGIVQDRMELAALGFRVT